MYSKFLQVEWVVCLVLLSEAVLSIGAWKLCAEPSEKHLSKRLAHLESSELGSSARQFIPGKEFNASHSFTSVVGERSTSPWSYRINEDKARYPRKLMEAYCLHKGCIGTNGKIDNTVLSMPYHTTVVVLRRKSNCKHKTFVYKKAMEKIALFCICVMPTGDKS
ncbi:interleukin-17D-like [Pristis pectinata]|uniref:interleukin-17D-like n=1 Tax=Pristis pectinata TaxID=685728 RepID=UPI00223CAD96|nr:interleukin-17D-like [Pristis pectinata]